MNSVHDSKDWHTLSQAPLQSPTVAVDPASSPKPSSAYSTPSTNGYSTNNNNTSNTFTQDTSLQQQQSNFPNNGEEDVEAKRLPGMIAHSQPNTPRPETNRVAQPTQDSPLYQQPTPFPTRNVVRGKQNIFANETGPYFSATEVYDNLYSADKSSLLNVRVQAKMDRGFFMTDNDWTCYRRNYFQVSSVFSIHGFNQFYAMNDPQQPQQIFVQVEGTLAPVQRFLLGVTSRVANSDKEIELVQHTPKRDKGPQFRPEPKPITPGGNLTMSSVANNQNIVTFERIQFKTATANNGKRRAAQQYYVCVIELYAETDRHQLVKVGSCRSAPLVVRGRSPGHYADIQDRHPLPPTETVQQQEGQRQHVFSTYQKPVAQHHHQQQQQQHVHTVMGAPSMPTPNTEYHSGQTTPTNGYPYYPPAGYTQHGYNASNNSNVSSPISHPPLPSPYAHHTQIPNYNIHDGHGEPYVNEFNNSNNNSPQTEEPKMMHNQPFHMQQTGPIESPHSGYDWQRARYNSSSSGSSSAPSPGQQHDQQPTYFAPHDGRSSYSPITPTYASSGRKYNTNSAVPNLATTTTNKA